MTDPVSRRLRELALRALHTGRPQFSRFLEPALLDEARHMANECGVRCDFYGGYPDAERVVAAFYDGDGPVPSDYPIAAVRIDWNPKFAQPAHRDLMGAVIALGMDRETLGDVAMGAHRGQPCGWLFAAPEMADYVAMSLESAGRASVRAQVTDETPEIAPPEGTELRVTVQNPRLDAVLAAGYHLSRAEAQKLIAAGLVKLNHAPNLHTDARLAEGDLISARGYGRLKLVAISGESRRGRLILHLFKYGK